MSEAADTPPPSAPAKRQSGKNRWVIAGFIVVAIALVALNVVRGRALSAPKNWGEDFEAALAQGKAEGRQIVVLFVRHPAGQIARKLIRYTIEKPDNRKAIKEGNFVPVMVRLKGAQKNELMATYDLKSMPTLILLSPDGEEICRREGTETQPEVPFRTEFLRGE